MRGAAVLPGQDVSGCGAPTFAPNLVHSMIVGVHAGDAGFLSHDHVIRDEASLVWVICPVERRAYVAGIVFPAG